MNVFCIASSFLFLPTAYYALGKNQLLYCRLFQLLFLTSIAFHLLPSLTAFSVADKLTLYSIVAYGGILFYQGLKRLPATTTTFLKMALILSTFLYVFYVFCIGNIWSTHCFDPNPVHAQLWHSSLHLASSIGHTAIASL